MPVECTGPKAVINFRYILRAWNIQVHLFIFLFQNTSMVIKCSWDLLSFQNHDGFKTTMVVKEFTLLYKGFKTTMVSKPQWWLSSPHYTKGENENLHISVSSPFIRFPLCFHMISVMLSIKQYSYWSYLKFTLDKKGSLVSPDVAGLQHPISSGFKS